MRIRVHLIKFEESAEIVVDASSTDEGIAKAIRIAEKNNNVFDRKKRKITAKVVEIL